MQKYILKNQWYILHTKSRFENVVKEGLERKNIETFLPRVTVRSKRRDRLKMIRVSLFPGYLFLKSRLTAPEHIRILKTVGAVRLIGSNEGPIPVPDETVDSLTIMTSSDHSVYTGTKFKKGDKIIVASGALAGVSGYFSRYQGKDRVIVNVDALGQYAAVDVDASEIEIVPEMMTSMT